MLPQHPLIVEAMDEIKDGEKLPPLVDSPQAGAAEVLFGLGTSLGRQGGEDLALAYLQLAIYLAPRHPLALMSLADLYESMKKPALALKVYQRVPADSPLKRNAEIQLATNLDALDRTEEAQEDPREADRRTGRTISKPSWRSAISCACARNSPTAPTSTARAIDTLKNPQKSNWLIFYFRGICNERSKQWPSAEADFKRALELSPDQPHVLNYLGYSWIDQGINLDEGMRMIRRAVEQRPDDGYIVDSLGWALLPHPGIRRGGEASRARGRAQARGSDHQRSSRRRLLEGRAHARGAVPVGACARPQAGAGRPQEDRREDCAPA